METFEQWAYNTTGMSFYDHTEEEKDQLIARYESAMNGNGVKPKPNVKETASKPTKKADDADIKDTETMIVELGYKLAYNQMNDLVEVNGERMTDVLEKDIRYTLASHGYRKRDLIDWAIHGEAKKNEYHPLKDYLNGLTYNGGDNIRELASYLETDEPETVYLFLRRWLIGAVAKVLDKQQNLVLVLEGPQGIGKSYFAQHLASGIDEKYFSDNRLVLDDKDTLIRSISLFIWEIGELGATTRKSDVEELKQFLTQKYALVRKPYGKEDIWKPITVSYIGTVNHDGGGFLADPTGNRRFLVAAITGIDRGYTKLDISQVWAEAVHLYRNGERAEPTDEEKRLQAMVNARYVMVSPMEDVLDEGYILKPGRFTPSREILEYLKDNGRFGTDTQIGMALAKIMKAKGIDKVKENNIWGYKGIAKNKRLNTT